MNNLSISEIIERINDLNPGVEAHRDEEITDFIIIFDNKNVDFEKLKLPHGYYFNAKNGITNKYHSKDGSYVSFLPICTYNL